MSTPAEASTARPDVAGMRVVAAIAAGIAVVPSVFWIGIQESFVTPKVVVVSVLAVLCVVFVAPRARLVPGEWRMFDWCVVAFAALVLVSYFRSVDRAQSFWGEEYQRQGLYATGLYLVFYALARSSIIDSWRLRTVARSASVGAIPVAVYALGQRAGLDLLWDEIPGGRVFSTIGQTNSLGAYLAMALPISLGVAVGAGRRSLLYWLAFGMQAAALVFTESRGGYLGVLVGLLVFAVLFARQHRWGWSRVATVATASILLMVIVAFNAPGVSESSERAWSRALSADEWTTGSIRNHLDLWTVARHVIVDHPVVGTGPDTFPLVFGDYRDDVLSVDSATRLRVYRVESPHNIVLAHAAGSGAPAAALLLVVMVGPAVAVGYHAGRVRDRREGAVQAGVAAGIVGGFVASMFITADFGTTWILWTMTGALVALGGRYSTSAATSGGSSTSLTDADSHSTSV